MTSILEIKTEPLPAETVGTLVIYVCQDGAPSGAGGEIWAATGLDWTSVAAVAGFSGRQGQLIDIVVPPRIDANRLLVLGAGKSEPAPDLTAFCDQGGSAYAKLGHAETVAFVLDDPQMSAAAVAEIAAGIRLRHYRFDKYKRAVEEGGSAAPKKLTVTLHVRDPIGAEAAIVHRLASVEGTLLARDLVNEPANVLGPVEFAAEAGKLAERGVEVEVLLPAEMQKLGMNSLLCVAQGSARPARLVVMGWNGGAAETPPLAFVGKGVTFDTGGISIKPAGAMEDMKGDMGGAAAVTGLIHALAARRAKVNAVGVIGLVENMPDANSVRPGDIVKAMSGTTIEIVNTDAEGRLVLADALWYTQERFKPRLMVNLATLTGAIIVALGHEYAGLYSNNDDLAIQLGAAGIASGEKLWRMPLGRAYDKLLESRFADVKNIGGRPAGSITAAQFLQRFVNDVPWAHLDIAGTAFGGPASETNASWGVGFGVALLNRFVEDNYES